MFKLLINGNSNLKFSDIYFFSKPVWFILCTKPVQMLKCETENSNLIQRRDESSSLFCLCSYLQPLLFFGKGSLFRISLFILIEIRSWAYSMLFEKDNGRERKWKNSNPPLKHNKDLEILFKKLAPTLTAAILAVSPICHPPGITKDSIFRVFS